MILTSVFRHFALVTLIITGITACNEDQTPSNSAIDFTVTSSKGERFDLKNSDHEWILINYWAEWCKPCIEEIPELNALHQESNILVIGINFDKLKGEKLEEQINKLKVEFPVALNDLSQIYGYPYPSVLPTTVVLNKNRQVSEILIGPQTKEDILKIIAKKN
jgi:thiol-disulfide isomerase/thioredoxin